MSADRARSRRTGHRAFRPTLGGRVELEPRLLLSGLKNVEYGNIQAHRGYKIQTASGGRAVLVTTPLDEQFYIKVQSLLNSGVSAVANAGTVRAYTLPNGLLGLRVDGTTPDSDLTISYINPFQRKGIAHQFSKGQALQNHLLYLGGVQVTSGQIGDIEGYHTTVLAGPISIGGTGPVDRIAVEAIAPGGSIYTGGTLNTLDVLYDMNFSGPGTGITTGLDLNWLDTLNGSLTLSNGANISIGRDLGLVPQPGKGTGPAAGAYAALIYGNVTINPGSAFTIGRSLVNTFGVFGNFNGISRLSQSVPGTGTVQVRGTVTP